MNFAVYSLTKNIFHVQFNSNEDMCRTMLRFEEHYESPKFRNKIFTLRQFKRWYKEEHGGKFTYYTDWEGLNIPGCVFRPFLDGKFDPLTFGEQSVLEYIPQQGKNFYLIATGPNNNALRHEIAHALYYLNEQYRDEVNSMVRHFPRRDRMKAAILKAGYCEDVVKDEMQAYAMHGYKEFYHMMGLDVYCTFRQKLMCRWVCRTLNFILNKYLQKLNVEV